MIKTQKATRCSYRQYSQLAMITSQSIVSYLASLITQQKSKGRGNKIVVGTVGKSKLGKLEEEVRAGSSRRLSK